jgi:Tfp pilus assembly protein PilV
VSQISHKQRGISLIEVTIFIVVVGLAMVAVIMGVGASLQNTPSSSQTTLALEQAQSRMDIILGQRAIVGFASFVDPCVATPALAFCQTSPYTVSSSIANNWNGDSNFKVITVTVTGAAKATLTGLVSNY